MKDAKKLISVLLIACLLTSNAAPAFSQARSIGRGVRGAVKPRTLGQISKNTFRVQAPYVPSTTIAPAALRSGVTFTGISLEQAVSKQITLQQMQAPLAIANRLRAQVRSGQWEGVATPIFQLPESCLQRPALLRNEFVTAALAGHAGKEQISKAVEFYRADLKQRASLLLNIKKTSASDFLSQTPSETLKIYQEIFSSAGALAALGNKEDAAVLVDFWQQAQGGPLEEVATNITGRGLLRFGAYADFNIWASSTLPRGEEWLAFDAYITAHEELPITFTVEEPIKVSLLPREQLSAWLGEGCAVNAINAVHSPYGTEWWVSLGKDLNLLNYIVSRTKPVSASVQVPGQLQVFVQPAAADAIPTLQIRCLI